MAIMTPEGHFIRACQSFLRESLPLSFKNSALLLSLSAPAGFSEPVGERPLQWTLKDPFTLVSEGLAHLYSAVWRLPALSDGAVDEVVCFVCHKDLVVKRQLTSPTVCCDICLHLLPACLTVCFSREKLESEPAHKP